MSILRISRHIKKPIYFKINMRIISHMTENLPKICVSLAPYSLHELTILAAKAIKQEADFVEIRFDYMPISDIKKAATELSSMDLCHRAIFTLRSRSEGGNFMDSSSERVKILEMLGLLNPMLLDVEFNTLKGNKSLMNFIQRNKIRLLVSWHNFLRTPTKSVILSKILQMRKYSRFIKVVTKANKLEDSFNMLSLYDDIRNTSLVAFAMGELGVLSRILCTIYGNAPFTYASLNKTIAPGQMPICMVRKLYDGIFRKV